jgi:2-hydroxy-3-oxopropionate reductase
MGLSLTISNTGLSITIALRTIYARSCAISILQAIQENTLHKGVEKLTIGFLGIGLMGKPMASNLIKAGFELIVWNRTASKAQPLAQLGARIAATPHDAAKANILITMLEAGPQVAEVIDAMLTAIEPGTLIIDMSSTKQSEAIALHAALEKIGIHFIDAPVSGGVIGAEAGSLAIMAGGSAADFALAEPVLNAMGKPTLVGGPGCGQLAKLCNQLIVGATLDIVAEALLLAQAGGADPAAVRKALRGGFAESRILEVHGQRMLERNFMPGGQVKSQLKDLENVLIAAADAHISLPVSEMVTKHYRSILESSPHADQSAVLLALEKINPGKRLGNSADKLP